MAVSGDNFCTSAWNGFLLHIKHGAKFAFANFLANLFIFIGKAAIVVLNCFTVFLIMQHVTDDLKEIDSPLVPVVFVAIVTYIVASIFLGLFDEVVLALLTCLCIDTDLNGGTPVFGPPTFYDDVRYFGGNKSKKDVEEEELDPERANSIS
jgi:choline transporter-like protein 2/4/5